VITVEYDGAAYRPAVIQVRVLVHAGTVGICDTDQATKLILMPEAPDATEALGNLVLPMTVPAGRRSRHARMPRAAGQRTVGAGANEK
jgi:hypothetical protein